MIEFHNGDRVVSLVDAPGDNYGIYQGDAGVVCGVNTWRDGWIAVCWDNPVPGGHNCGGLCVQGYGWHVPAEALGLERDDDEPPFQFDEEAFANLFK